jgi:hypothetical protein
MAQSEEKISPSQHPRIRSRIRLVLGTLIVFLGFGWDYYDSVHKNWSWPVAVLLAGIWGAVCFWIMRRLERDNGTKLPEKESDGRGEF